MTTDTEALRAQFEAWATAAYGLSFDKDTPLKRYLWAAYQAGHAAAKAETADAVAAERERAATVVDEKIGSVRKANPGRGGRINSAVAFALDALGYCAAAIRAGAKEPGDA